jgi:hypothetical protein
MLHKKEENLVILCTIPKKFCSILLHTIVTGWILSVDYRIKIKYKSILTEDNLNLITWTLVY